VATLNLALERKASHTWLRRGALEPSKRDATLGQYRYVCISLRLQCLASYSRAASPFPLRAEDYGALLEGGFLAGF
jgi:hypothetical protein